MDLLLNLSFIALALLLGLWMLYRSSVRHAIDVAHDLHDEIMRELRSTEETERSGLERAQAHRERELAEIGIFDQRTARRMLRWKKLAPIFAAVAVMLLRVLCSSPAPAALVINGMMAACAAHLILSAWYRGQKRTYLRQIEFHLPLVMERLVMAVHAGLDIVPAIQTILSLEEERKRAAPSSAQFGDDPVSELLMRAHRLAERGLGFEQSLREVAAGVSSSSLRHAFVHLALAQKDGGELIAPLRELSDSTQLYFQESVEEEIARMPVKATIPLVCTFAGLILCFITAPLIQIITITQQAIPK